MPKKRQDGRYEIKVRVSKPNEPRKYKAVYGSTLKEAQAKAKKLTADVDAGIDITINPTVSEVIDYWLDLKKPTIRPSSYVSYTNSLRYAKDFLGSKPIRDITVDDARKLYALIHAKYPKQARQCKGRMYSVCSDAIARGLMNRNPFAYTQTIRTPQPQKRKLTAEELQAVEDALPRLTPFDRAFLATLRYTGMRKGEVLALSPDDLHFDERRISVRRSSTDGIIGPTKTKAGEREVPMPDALADILKDYLDHYYEGHPYRQYGMDVPLFPNRNMTCLADSSFGVHWRNIKKVIFGEDPPNDFTPHIFRHTYASELVVNHVPPTTAMLVLGHESFKTTMSIYTHFGYKDIDSEAVMRIFK